MMRIGHGFDVHRLVDGSDHSAGTRPLVLGGVAIPCAFRIVAHSDGDVLLHALMDALLGAAALGDIGHWFPDSDPAYAGVDSRQLLRHCLAQISQQGWQLANADLTLVAQQPRIAVHVPQMRATIAESLGIQTCQINVKATTTERRGAIGRGEGIAAHAVALLQRATPGNQATPSQGITAS